MCNCGECVECRIVRAMEQWEDLNRVNENDREQFEIETVFIKI
jgi:hypothetical protein